MPSGSATTVNSAVSGIAPPLVMAASRAAAPRPQLAVHAVVMHVGAVTAAPRRNALGKHFEDRVVGFAREIAIGIGARDQGEQFIFVPAAGIVSSASRRGRAARPRCVRPSSEARIRRARQRMRATICCARMSSGASGMIRRSRSPCRIARTSAAHSSRSSRVPAKNRPLGTAPRQWPERPTRCKATAIARGELICTTRSTVPISIPSSSDAVATSTLTLPSFSFCSAARRSLRDRLP